jgi:opacity protein-like surface antigen
VRFDASIVCRLWFESEDQTQGQDLRETLRSAFIVVAFAAALGAGPAPACAQEGKAPPLPIFAAFQPKPEEPSLWRGLYVGSEMFVVSGKSVKGGLGGGGFVGYDHVFPDHVIVGVQASAGYSPGLFPQSAWRGFDFVNANMRLGYDMGRWTPFVTVGVALAKPDMAGRGFVSAGDSFNGLFDQSAGVRGFGTVGAGVDYAVTDRLKVGVELSAGSGRGYWIP